MRVRAGRLSGTGSTKEKALKKEEEVIFMVMIFMVMIFIVVNLVLNVVLMSMCFMIVNVKVIIMRARRRAMLVSSK